MDLCVCLQHAFHQCPSVVVCTSHPVTGTIAVLRVWDTPMLKQLLWMVYVLVRTWLSACCAYGSHSFFYKDCESPQLLPDLALLLTGMRPR